MPINQYQEVELFELFFGLLTLLLCMCILYVVCILNLQKKQELIFDHAILILLNTQNDQKEMVVYLE